MNFKLRLKNKVTLTAIVTLAISFIYSILAMIGIVPNISENDVLMVIKQLIDLLALLGIVVDPTTVGVKDSARAMTYLEPNELTEFEHFEVGGENEATTETEHEHFDPEV